MADSKLYVGGSRFPFYAVGRGLRPDVYHTWRECHAMTHGIKGNKHKGFHNYEKAQDYVRRLYKVLYRPKVADKFRNVATSAFALNLDLKIENMALLPPEVQEAISDMLYKQKAFMNSLPTVISRRPEPARNDCACDPDPIYEGGAFIGYQTGYQNDGPSNTPNRGGLGQGWPNESLQSQ